MATWFISPPDMTMTSTSEQPPFGPVATDLAALRAAEAAASATYAEAIFAFRAAESAKENAHSVLLKARAALEKAETLADYHALTPDQQAALSGPCPQGRDAKWWINRGWVERYKEASWSRKSNTSVPWWRWSRKTRQLHEFLKEQP